MDAFSTTAAAGGASTSTAAASASAEKRRLQEMQQTQHWQHSHKHQEHLQQQQRWPAADNYEDAAPSYRSVELSVAKEPLRPYHPQQQQPQAQAAYIRDYKQPLFPPESVRMAPQQQQQYQQQQQQQDGTHGSSSSQSLSFPPPPAIAVPVPVAVPATPVVDPSLNKRDNTVYSYPPEDMATAKKEVYGSQPPEKKKTNKTLIIVLIALAAVILAGGAIAAALILTNNNKSSSSSSSSSSAAGVPPQTVTQTVSGPAPAATTGASQSQSSAAAATSTVSTAGPTAVPAKFQIRLHGTTNCVVGGAVETCEASPAATSKQVFVQDLATWKQVSSGLCITTFVVSTIDLVQCDGTSTFQQMNYWNDGSIRNGFPTCVSPTLTAPPGGKSCGVFDLVTVA
ncbi:hypothetical protein DFJ73DRAFT_793267 [Zopfochytrium polystomum]|nr:hypothetical protein DFJ73DRAFT_793267 [Zopfochytrium polystomum]